MTSHLLVVILTLLIHQIDQSILSPLLQKVSNPRSESSGEEQEESTRRYFRFVSRALEEGYKDAKELFETIEPSLYAQNIINPEDHPPRYLAAINYQSQRAKNLSRYAYASLRATQSLQKILSQLPNINNGNDELANFPLGNSPLQEFNCLDKRLIKDCTITTRFYRTANGTCNNLKHPNWGSSLQPFARYLPSEYDDDVSTIRKSVSGNELPSPRKISSKIHIEISRAPAVHTFMIMLWRQFLDHDLRLTAPTRGFNNSVPKCCNVATLTHPECLPIPVPIDDPFYNGTIDCLEFVRSSPSPRSDCGLGPREQLNELTSWLDGSLVYGSSDEEQRELRLFRGGKLKYHKISNRKPLLPRHQNPQNGDAFPGFLYFKAGDIRVNQDPGLAAMHTIWLRQHNLMAHKLSLLNPQWSEETTFQETRKIVIAQLQHITFREFLPHVLGPNVVKTFGLRALRTGYYDGYNESVDGTVPTAFASAAFRFDSLVDANLLRWNSEFSNRINSSIELLTASNLRTAREIYRITLGLISQRFQEPNESITAELPNNLFKNPASGLDLAAVNIQRGRDHGLAPYLKWREACGLLKPLKRNGPLVSWDDFEEATGLEHYKVDSLAGIYENPWDVDLFPAGMLEVPVRGGLVGTTFACVIGQTFRNIRRGDRFWYENPGHFTLSQLQAIRNVSLARVLCDTSDSITSIQPVVFLAPQLQRNPRAACSNSDAIPSMQYAPWNHVSSSEAIFHRPAEEKISNISPVTLNYKPSFYTLTNYSSEVTNLGAGNVAVKPFVNSTNSTRRSS